MVVYEKCMKDSPFSPFLPFSLIAESITYIESTGIWSSNPPPATNLDVRKSSAYFKNFNISFNFGVSDD
jgi:hypothetical protein